jgi:hypothetical protein
VTSAYTARAPSTELDSRPVFETFAGFPTGTEGGGQHHSAAPRSGAGKTGSHPVLTNTIDADRYPLSPRIRALKGILDKIAPPPVWEPLPPPKVYAQPRATIARRRRRG